MIRELTRGIDKYLSLKKTGHEGKLVKNSDVRGRFINARAWDSSPDQVWAKKHNLRNLSEYIGKIDSI